jgi:hypothetical protein
MEDFDSRTATFREPVKQRSAGWRFGDLGDRLARAFSPSVRTASLRTVNGAHAHPLADEDSWYEDSVLPRFPITRQGYDCDAVDSHVAELEAELYEVQRELDEIRASTPSRNDVAAEIDRIGEQTSAVLLAAHDTAEETIQLAHAQADRCVAEATINAEAITQQARTQLDEMQAGIGAITRERERLVEEIRRTSTALLSLAGEPGDG